MSRDHSSGTEGKGSESQGEGTKPSAAVSSNMADGHPSNRGDMVLDGLGERVQCVVYPTEHPQALTQPQRWFQCHMIPTTRIF